MNDPRHPRHAHPRQRGDVAGLLLGMLVILLFACAAVTGPVTP